MSPDEKKYRKWMEGVVAKYRGVLGLEKHDIAVEREEKTNRYLNCVFRYPYLDNTIQYSNASMRDWKADPVKHERVVIHELCHIITDPLYAVACDRFIGKQQLEDAREHLTDCIAVIVARLHKIV
jgi:hypothetical protein